MLFKTLFIDHFKKNSIHLICFIILLIVIYPIESVLLSRLFSQLFELVNKNKKLPSFTDFYNNLIQQNAPGLILMIICVYVILFFIYLSKNHLETLILPNYYKYLRVTLFDNIIKKYSNDYKDIKIGEVLSKLIELNYSILYLFINVFEYFLTTFSGLLCINVYFFILNWKIGLLYFISMCSIFGVYLYQSSSFIDNSMGKMKILYDINESASDKLSNLMNIYLNNGDKKEMKEYTKKEHSFRNKFMKNIWLEKQSMSFCDFIIIAFTILIIVLSYYYLKNKEISTTSFVSIVITASASMVYLYRLNKQISDSIYYYSIIKSNEKFLTNILIKNKQNIKKVDLQHGKIEFKNVYFRYDTGTKYILKNFNYIIKPKMKVAFIGQSGSGKSTIMKLLIHLHPLTKGNIYIDDEDINHIDTHYLRNKVIYVNQKTVLFNDSVLHNIQYGTHYKEDYIMKLMKKYDLLTLFDKLPFGLKSNCGVNGNNLSLGMQKVIITLRGILKPGVVYILDEPLTSLDDQTKKKIIKMLMAELKDKTMIVITHDKEIIPYMNKTMNINHLR